ncbi:MAG: hypothetical protein EXS08_10690 [Planctomycetes bacterium]|nr:hypothetical protein [Planctomycetota bacterium]
MKTKRAQHKNGLPSAKHVELGRVLAEGGEGKIHELPARPGFVAKVYHQTPSAEKAAKLTALVEARTPALLKVAAWPIELLRATPGGAPIGVVLPRIDEPKDIHLLYGPRSRLSAFPLAGWPFLIRAAANLARAFAVVHAHGHVLGDVNDRVALVTDRALVSLIDCDGFQLAHKGRSYACDVGVPTHQPPELQGVKSFRGLSRSANHDAFGLAVLIFQLLFLARHPFSGSYGDDGDMPLERAIREFRFVYGAKAAERGLQPPPMALDLSCVTRDVARLFEQAFGPSGVQARPSAKQWVVALDELGRLVQRCRTNPSHAYLKGRSCPFCAIDRQTDMALFHLPLSSGSARQRSVPVHLPSLWKEIAGVEAPGPTAALPAALLTLQRQCLLDARGRAWRVAGRAALVLVALALAWPTGGLSLALLLLLPVAQTQSCRTPGGPALAQRVRDFVRRWNEKAAGSVFQQRLKELERARAELEGLDNEHAHKLRALESERRRHQLDAFLGRVRIAAAEIPAVEPGLKAVLESYGIETADEVSEAALARVRALPELARRALLSWRAQQESRFVFDPARAVDPAARATLERQTHKRRADLVQKLVDGPAKLRHRAGQIRSARQTLGAELGPLLADVERETKRARGAA